MKLKKIMDKDEKPLDIMLFRIYQMCIVDVLLIGSAKAFLPQSLVIFNPQVDAFSRYDNNKQNEKEIS